MSKYIKQEDVKKRIKELLCIPGDDDEVVKYIQKQVLDKLPSIDIVSCKDCEYWSNCSKAVEYDVWKNYFKAVDYCSRGKQEEQEHE